MRVVSYTENFQKGTVIQQSYIWRVMCDPIIATHVAYQDATIVATFFQNTRSELNRKFSKRKGYQTILNLDSHV